jgi:hypothetical protein
MTAHSDKKEKRSPALSYSNKQKAMLSMVQQIPINDRLFLPTGMPRCRMMKNGSKKTP